jgi:hypothetical protein
MKQFYAQEVITSTVSVKQFATVLTEKLKRIVDPILYRPSAKQFEVIWYRGDSGFRHTSQAIALFCC